jgi:MADS-box transcription factor
LNAPEPASSNDNGIDDNNQVESPDDNSHAQMPRNALPPQNNLPYGGGNGMGGQNNLTPEQAMQYGNYLQGAQSQYPPMPHNQMAGHRQQ